MDNQSNASKMKEKTAGNLGAGAFPLTTVGDLDMLIKDSEAGEHNGLLSRMTNDKRIQSTPSDPIIQSVDINTKATSYARVAGASAKGQPKVNSNFRPLVADLVFDGVNISIPRKVFKKGRSSFARCLIEVNPEADLVDVVTIGIPLLTGDGFTKETIRIEYEWRPPSPPIVTTSNVVTPTIQKTNDDFQTMGKKKKRKGKSKSTNGGQFAGPLVKQNVRHEPKATTSAPKKEATNVGNASKSSSMLKTAGNSPTKDNITTSNSYFVLNDKEEDEEEHFENVYDESANLFPNTKIGGSSSFTAAG
ncbi:hypothetical protein Tco_1146324 [Tanacetum coccineum]